MIVFGEKGIKDLDKLIDDVTYFGVALYDQKEPMGKIKEYQGKQWRKNYFTLGKEYGVWNSLRDYTLWIRQKQGYADKQMMMRTGTMLGWMDSRSQAGIVAAQSVTWEFEATGSHTDGSYAAFHDEGFNHHWGTYVEPRVLWDVNDKDEEKIEKYLVSWVDGLIKKHIGA